MRSRFRIRPDRGGGLGVLLVPAVYAAGETPQRQRSEHEREVAQRDVEMRPGYQ